MEAVSAAPPDLAGPLAAGRRLGRYEVLAKLAAGGMAVVYVARAQGAAGFERLVALKVLHANLAHEEEFIRMFLDEARLAARIRHPNVVPTTDISDTAEAGYFLVMDYIEGDHLGALLSGAHKANERIPVNVVLRIVVDALGGLGAAHDLTEQGRPLNLVHRDVSPHNIMVGKDGVSRLTDFGVAKAEDRLTHTRDGQVKGKLAYMAPEQAAYGNADRRSDLFSMGIILWECVTGRRLFRGGNTAQTLHKLLNDEVPPVSSVHAELAPLDPVLKRALQRDPALRFQSADEFAQAIEAVAPAFRGLASFRDVTKAVTSYAATRLRRDKKLIDDAMQSIRRREAGGVGADADALSEPSVPSAPEPSDPSSSLSVSKASGVFSYATSPGGRPKVAGGPPLAPPPPVGASLSDAADEFASGLRPKWAQRFLWIAGGCLTAAAVWYFGMRGGSRPVEVIEVGPTAPPAAATPSAQPTPPAEIAPTAAEAVAEPAAAEPRVEPATDEDEAQAKNTDLEPRSEDATAPKVKARRAPKPAATATLPASAPAPTPAPKKPVVDAPTDELLFNPYKK
jgi:serine/threonine-protein kinase